MFPISQSHPHYFAAARQESSENHNIIINDACEVTTNNYTEDENNNGVNGELCLRINYPYRFNTLKEINTNPLSIEKEKAAMKEFLENKVTKVVPKVKDSFIKHLIETRKYADELLNTLTTKKRNIKEYLDLEQQYMEKDLIKQHENIKEYVRSQINGTHNYTIVLRADKIKELELYVEKECQSIKNL